MPQMAPMWWTTLFFLFIICFVLVMVLMYFNMNKMPKTAGLKSININKMNWKW